jgi:hypothetical protein
MFLIVQSLLKLIQQDGEHGWRRVALARAKPMIDEETHAVMLLEA